MRVCIPIQEDRGLESIPFNHFGSAPNFLIYDLENGDTKVIENDDAHHTHGMCHPLKAIGEENIDIILVRGIGAGALSKLHNAGINSYKAEEGTVFENISMLKQNKLIKYSLNDVCSDHNCGD